MPYFNAPLAFAVSKTRRLETEPSSKARETRLRPLDHKIERAPTPAGLGSAVRGYDARLTLSQESPGGNAAVQLFKTSWKQRLRKIYD